MVRPLVFTQISRSQAAQVTRTPHACNPARTRAHTDSWTVAPVVTTSSTTMISALCRISRPLDRTGTLTTRPRRLRARSAGVRPTESRTPCPIRNIGNTQQSGRHRAATRAERSTGSPPRRRAATARLGAGTNTNGRPAVRSTARPAARATPNGSAKSRRPLSFAANTARRAGPAYEPSVQHEIPGAPRGHTRTGGPASAAWQSMHHLRSGRPQPAQSTGTTRSRRVLIARVCTPTPTDSAARQIRSPRDQVSWSGTFPAAGRSQPNSSARQLSRQ